MSLGKREEQIRSIRTTWTELKTRQGETNFRGLLELLKSADPSFEDRLQRHAAVRGLWRALELEPTIDFNQAGDDRTRLIGDLGKCTEPEDLRQLVSLSLQFKNNLITPATYHQYLLEMAERYQLDVDYLPNFQAYAAYVAIYEYISLKEVLSQMEDLTSEVIRRLES